ncbi:HAD-IIA family hydrolase [Pseudodonghicola flavimaris]|uniref:HAD hydrolase-like protein n=1 Tax=Pseudodonghicola flavimaris TaxID=3050036 RepID=A0ABT7F5R2_9RHOB|nr:HAD family hydrolase [Pseudodonghicola flavimaris]MDK3019942.1 HAD hydrolase-like protein [Pseudodonghicola flavimaris]
MPHPIRLSDFLDSPGPDRAAVLADLDGCLLSGETVLPDVPRLLARCGDRLWIVSNNSTDTAQTLAVRLARLGLPVPAGRILLAGEMTLRTLQAERPGARVALFAASPLQVLACALGLYPDRRRPDLMVIARDTGLSFDDLAEIIALAHAGVPVRLTNPDITHPGADGTPCPETGALWAAVTAAVPRAAAVSLGKPAPDLLRRALRRAGVAPRDAVFIGDTPETDGAAAAAAGVDFVLLARPGAPARDLLQREASSC